MSQQELVTAIEALRLARKDGDEVKIREADAKVAFILKTIMIQKGKGVGSSTIGAPSTLVPVDSSPVTTQTTPITNEGWYATFADFFGINSTDTSEQTDKKIQEKINELQTLLDAERVKVDQYERTQKELETAQKKLLEENRSLAEKIAELAKQEGDAEKLAEANKKLEECTRTENTFKAFEETAKKEKEELNRTIKDLQTKLLFAKQGKAQTVSVTTPPPADDESILQRFTRLFTGDGTKFEYGTTILGTPDMENYGKDTDEEKNVMKEAIANNDRKKLLAYTESKIGRVLNILDTDKTVDIEKVRNVLKNTVEQLIVHANSIVETSRNVPNDQKESQEKFEKEFTFFSAFFMTKLATGREFPYDETKEYLKQQYNKDGVVTLEGYAKPKVLTVPWTTDEDDRTGHTKPNNQLLINDRLPIDKNISVAFEELFTKLGRAENAELFAKDSITTLKKNKRFAGNLKPPLLDGNKTINLLQAWYPNQIKGNDKLPFVTWDKYELVMSGRPADTYIGLAIITAVNLSRLLEENVVTDGDVRGEGETRSIDERTEAKRRHAIQLLFYTPWEEARSKMGFNRNIETKQTTIFRALSLRPYITGDNDVKEYMKSAAFGFGKKTIPEDAVSNASVAGRTLDSDAAIAAVRSTTDVKIRQQAAETAVKAALNSGKGKDEIQAFIKAVKSDEVNFWNYVGPVTRLRTWKSSAREIADALELFERTESLPERSIIAKINMANLTHGSEEWNEVVKTVPKEFIAAAGLQTPSGIRLMTELERGALSGNYRQVLAVLPKHYIDTVAINNAMLTAITMNSDQVVMALCASGAADKVTSKTWQLASVWAPDDRFDELIASAAQSGSTNSAVSANDVVQQLQEIYLVKNNTGSSHRNTAVKNTIDNYFKIIFSKSSRETGGELVLPIENYLQSQGTSLEEVYSRDNLQDIQDMANTFASNQFNIDENSTIFGQKLSSELSTILESKKKTSAKIAISNSVRDETKVILKKDWTTQNTDVSKKENGEKYDNSRKTAKNTNTDSESSSSRQHNKSTTSSDGDFSDIVDITSAILRVIPSDQLGMVAMEKATAWLDKNKEHPSKLVSRTEWNASIQRMRDALETSGFGTEDAETFQALQAFDSRYEIY